MAMLDSGSLMAWREAREALETHARLGKQLQRMGLEKLAAKGEDMEARALLNDGVRIEAAARLEIFRLERNKPKK